MEERIKISGARAGGLRDVDLELALGKVLCFTGRSSNGRLAMAVDVLYAESRRRYIQALSPVEREGIGGVGKAELDEITGLPPAKIIELTTAVQVFVVVITSLPSTFMHLNAISKAEVPELTPTDSRQPI